MARFLFTTLPSDDLGLLTRSLPIARGLSALEHEVLFSSPGRAPSTLIEEAGFANEVPRHPLYHLNPSDLSPGAIYRVATSKPLKTEFGSALRVFLELLRSIPLRFAPRTAEIWNMDHAAAMAGMMNTNFVASNVRALTRLVERIDPDVIVDFWNPFACIAARILDRPLITVIQADGHPANKGLIWWKERPKKLPTALPAINRVLTRHGLAGLAKLEELNLGDLTLILGTPDLDPIPHGSPGTWVGPVLWQQDDAEPPSFFHELHDRSPIIWVYSGNPRYAHKGTVLDSEVIISSCIQVLGGSDYQVVLSTGHHELPNRYLPLPDNFRFARYVPGLAMAEKSDLLIHHGGYGSCQTGLFSGTPAVIIPTFSERESNARRVAAAGAGEVVLPTTRTKGGKGLDLEVFSELIQRVLKDPTYSDKARRCGDTLRSYGGEVRAVDLIAQFVDSSVNRWLPKQPGR